MIISTDLRSFLAGERKTYPPFTRLSTLLLIAGSLIPNVLASWRTDFTLELKRAFKI